MASNNLKRNRNSQEESKIKRQKSKPGFDDTDGRTDVSYTQEDNERNVRDRQRDSEIRKTLFPEGAQLLSTNGHDGDESMNHRTNEGLKSQKVESMDTDTERAAIDSVDFCSNTAIQNTHVSQCGNVNNLRKKYSAGANIGHFKMRYKNVCQTNGSKYFCRKYTAGADIGHFQIDDPNVKNGSSVSQTPNNPSTVSQTPRNDIACSIGISNSPGADANYFHYRRAGFKPKRTNVMQTCARRPCTRRMRKQKSDLETDDLDMDIIYATGVKTDESDTTPKSVPVKFTRVKLQPSSGAFTCLMRRISPNTVTSPLYIQHTGATDDPVLGDRFGADIETTKKPDHGYYRHVIKEIDVNGVADNMEIQGGDELILINGTFAPDLDHKAVLHLFSSVPVDQHTRLTLVLRRPADKKWVTTSAILVPELEKPPEVRDLRIKNDKGKTTIEQHWYTIQINGTQLFLIMTGGEIRVQVATGDPKDYNICVMSKLALDPSSGDTSYQACLFGPHHEDKFMNHYIHVNNSGEIGLDAGLCRTCSETRLLVFPRGGSFVSIGKLQKEPQWFGYGRKGKRMILKVQELQKYIGCLEYNYGTTGHLCIQDEEYDNFIANALDTSYDHPDTGHAPLSLSHSQGSSGSEPLSLRLSGASDTSLGSFSSCSSNNGSLRDSGYDGMSRSNQGHDEGSRSSSFEDPVLDSGSTLYLSCNSGSCGTPNTPMAGLSLFSSETRPFKDA